jgi:hypothetical protein
MGILAKRSPFQWRSYFGRPWARCPVAGMGDEKTGTPLSTLLKIASSNRSRMLLGRRRYRSSNGRRFRDSEARQLVIRAGAEECS